MPGVFAISLAAISLKPGGADTSHVLTTSGALSGDEHFRYDPEARDFDFVPIGEQVYVVFCRERGDEELLRTQMMKSTEDGIVHFQAVFRHGAWVGWMDIFQSESGLPRQDKIDWKFPEPQSWMNSKVYFKISTNPSCDGSATEDNRLNFVGDSKMIWHTHARDRLRLLTEESFLNKGGSGVAAIYNTDAEAIACANVKKLDSLPNEDIKSVFAAHFVTEVKGAVVVEARAAHRDQDAEWDFFLSLSGLDLRCANHQHPQYEYDADNFACRVAFHPGRSCDDIASVHNGMMRLMHFPLQQVEPVTASGDRTLIATNDIDEDDDKWHTYMNMFGNMFRAKDGDSDDQLTCPIPHAFEPQVHQHNFVGTHGGPAN